MTKIIQRHDTAANWTSVNPVLAAGEMGVETDTNKFKFGDGTTTWSSLAYAAGEGGGIDAYTKAETDDLLNTKQDKLTAVGSVNIATKDLTNINIVENITGGSLTSSYTYTLSSNMSGAGYGLVTLPNKVINFSTASSWEVVVKTTVGIKGVNYVRIFGSLTAGFEFGIFCNSGYTYIKQRISLNGSSWAFDRNYNIQNKTINYLKVSFDGTKYQFSDSADGITFNNRDSYRSSNTIKDSRIGLAYSNSSDNYYPASISLPESYYIIDGIKIPFVEILGEVLAISNDTATTSSLGVVQPDGTSITISETGVISGQDVKTFTGYSDTGTLVLKSINGVLQWVAEG